MILKQGNFGIFNSKLCWKWESEENRCDSLFWWDGKEELMHPMPPSLRTARMAERLFKDAHLKLSFAEQPFPPHQHIIESQCCKWHEVWEWLLEPLKT